jgi:hypothetical protein
VTYSVSPTKIGVDSCERSVPSCSAHWTLRFFTLPVVTWLAVEKRVLPVSPPYTGQPCAPADDAEPRAAARATVWKRSFMGCLLVRRTSSAHQVLENVPPSS